jgi:hypothetical protein
LLSLAAFAALALPVAALAQEMEETPDVLRLSFFMCDLGGDNGDVLTQEMETRDMPIWNALVTEGKVESYGYFFHWWADEWNVGVYTIAESIQAIVDASGEADDRATAQYGDAETAFSRFCPHHRDGFYTMGPNTGDDEDDEDDQD